MKGVLLRIGSGKDVEVIEASKGVTVEGRDVSLHCEEYPDSKNVSFVLTPPREYHFKTAREGHEPFSFRVYCYEHQAGVRLGNTWVKVLFDTQKPQEAESRWDRLDHDDPV
jgi:hypothetical protein